MKLTQNEKDILAGLSRALKRDFKAEKVLLFGSAARNQMDQDSDIDVLVVLPENRWDIEKRIIELCFAAELECGRIISTICFSRDEFYNSPLKESPLVLNALKQGQWL
jgi:predicted nucleotidyltransferase